MEYFIVLPTQCRTWGYPDLSDQHSPITSSEISCVAARRYVNQHCSVRITEYVITPQPMMGFFRDMVQTDSLSSRQMVDERKEGIST
jgi:hypothetical protein